MCEDMWTRECVSGVDTQQPLLTHHDAQFHFEQHTLTLSTPSSTLKKHILPCGNIKIVPVCLSKLFSWHVVSIDHWNMHTKKGKLKGEKKK